MHLDDVGNAVADSFYQYAKWYNLKVDTSPLIASRRFLAQRATRDNKLFLESNPYMSLHTQDFMNELNAKIVIVYRDPKRVIESHYNKGWYNEMSQQFGLKKLKAPGYQYEFEKPNHFFGRFHPKTETEQLTWDNLTRVGKISWMWSAVYTDILSMIETNSNHVFLIKLEDFDYDCYKKCCEFIGSNKVNELAFNQIKSKKPGKAQYTDYPDWNEVEFQEFDNLTKAVYDKLNACFEKTKD